MSGSPIQIYQKPALPKRGQPITIIGAGGIVHDAHLPAYQKAAFPVHGIFDLNEARARELAGKFGIPHVFRTLEEAVVSSPGHAVFDVAVPAGAIVSVLPDVPDGRAVLIQKPMGETLEQAKAIRDLCQRKNLKAAVNFQLRYAPQILAARSLIEQGAIGEVNHMEVRVCVFTPWHLWSFIQGIPRAEILYHSIHYLDLMRSFLGEPRGVYAKTVQNPKLPKLASTRSNILLDYGNTVVAAISANHDHAFGVRHQESFVKWEGACGAILATLGVLMNYPQGVSDRLEYCVLHEGAASEWTEVPLEGTWFPDAFIGTMASLQRFAEGSTRELPTSVEDAYRTMEVVDAAYQSSADGATPVHSEQRHA
jgi:predicted dehydrogenase